MTCALRQLGGGTKLFSDAIKRWVEGHIRFLGGEVFLFVSSRLPLQDPYSANAPRGTSSKRKNAHYCT
jgi:hypothetical protein